MPARPVTCHVAAPTPGCVRPLEARCPVHVQPLLAFAACAKCDAGTGVRGPVPTTRPGLRRDRKARTGVCLPGRAGAATVALVRPRSPAGARSKDARTNDRAPWMQRPLDRQARQDPCPSRGELSTLTWRG